MPFNTKKLLIFVLSFIFTFVIFSSVALAKNAYVFSITGGTAGQRAEAFSSLEESSFDWTFGVDVYPTTKVTIARSSRYWPDPLIPTCIYPLDVDPNHYLFTNEYNDVLGYAEYPSGNVTLRQYYPGTELASGPLFYEVVHHEADHARIWFVFMMRAGVTISINEDQAPAIADWYEIVTAGISPGLVNGSWYYMPCESHAEWARVAYGVVSKMVNQEPRTYLADPGGVLAVRAWHNKWCNGNTTTSSTTTTTTKPTTTTTTTVPTTTTTTKPTTTTTIPTTTTTTLPPSEPKTIFKDVPEDFWAAREIYYCYDMGYFWGYTDGNFGPYDEILVGQVNKVLGTPSSIGYWETATRKFVSDKANTPLFGRNDWTIGLYDSITRAQVAVLLFNRDFQARNPSATDTLIGYWDRSSAEVKYLDTYAKNARLTVTKEKLVQLYNKWGQIFGIRADMALAQAIKETGHFAYGGIVQWTDNNFCGLGATGSAAPAQFKTAELGVIAHYAHLACYAFPTDLAIAQCSKTYDPRHDHTIYHRLNPNSGKTIWSQLNGVWAVPGICYAQDIAVIANRFK